MKSFLLKIKSFFKKNSKTLIKLLMIVGALVALSLVAFLILCAFGVMGFENGEMTLNKELFDSFTNSWYGALIVILLQIVITNLLCFIPGASMTFIVLLTLIYPNNLTSFLIAFAGVMASSCLMYVTGRIGGYAICKRLLGEEDCKKASDLLNDKGLIFFPLMMMFPVFPDDAIVMISGTLKMSLKWFIPSIIIGRGIGIATITFGLTSIPFDKFTTPWHWIGFILACAVGIFLIFFLAYKFNNYLQKSRKSHSKAAEAANEETTASAESEAMANAEETEKEAAVIKEDTSEPVNS